ncbi:hypothetical protein F4778DRAFT_166631 [Xylariomycetidae sp. FL2044]|nr:hypothetical protein F4778DRAFT_166631 [Xylariomycetidae sp. FL2044]
MVEVLRVPSLGQHLSGPSDMMMEMPAGRFRNMAMESIHETAFQQPKGLATKDKNFRDSSSLRVPRRAFSTCDYQIQAAPSTRALHTQHLLLTPSPSPQESRGTDSYFKLPYRQKQLSSVPASPLTPQSTQASPSVASGETSQNAAPAAKRPSMPAPQRSYSVMDFEPIPFTHRPGATLTLPDLPPELHYAIFDFLDPIDSTCLGLTSRHFYGIQRAMRHARPIPLAARREGPNDMEWVWRNAGPFLPSGVSKQNSLAMLSPRGQVYCRKCRTQRCELHNHIRDWVGDAMEYCEVTQKFGPAAVEGAKAFCHRSSPRHPHRCGRHTRNQRQVRLV